MNKNVTAREAGAVARAATWADAGALAQTMGPGFDDPLTCFILANEATRRSCCVCSACCSSSACRMAPAM